MAVHSPVIEVADPVTNKVHTEQITTTYDADGNVLTQTAAETTGGDASRTVSYTYNGYDQKASSTDAANATTSYTYDAYGNQASKKDPAGNVTDYTYDPDGHLLTTTLVGYTGSPAGSQSAKNVTEESRAYDPAGRLASVTDAMGRITSYTYTDNDLTAKITRSGPGYTGTYVQEADTYDAAGNLIAKVTNNGATTTDYTVDAGDQVTNQTVDPNGLDRVTAYTYDGDDHVLTQNVSQGSNSPIQSTSYTYDAMGNKTSETVQDPVAEGPAAWWTLTQSSGTTVSDTSGTGNLATATGVTWSGSGAVLTGQGGQDITTRGPVVDTTGSFSVSAWVKMAAKTGNDEDVVSQDAGSVAGFYLKYNSATGTWQFTRPEQDENNPSNWATADSGTAAKTGTWTFLTGVYNVNTGAVQLYVNGTDAGGDTTDSTPIAANGPAEIGAAKWDGQTAEGTFDGSLTNVEIYPTALSATEVGNLYGQGSGGGDLVRGALTTSYTVDQLGQVVAQTDPDGITTTYAYDTAGHQTVVTDASTFNYIKILSQWYSGMTHTDANAVGSSGSADYIVFESTFTGRIPANWTPRNVYTPVTIPNIYLLPGVGKPPVPGEVVGATPCVGFSGSVSYCAKAPTPASGNGGAMVRTSQGFYQSTIYQNEKWRPVTVAVSYIYARNGASFVAVSMGPSTGQTAEPESGVAAAVRLGYFRSAAPLASDEIDKELTGTFTEVGVSVNGLQTAVVRNNGSGGIALELGKEVAFPDEPFGGEVLSGNSFQISGP